MLPGGGLPVLPRLRPLLLRLFGWGNPSVARYRDQQERKCFSLQFVRKLSFARSEVEHFPDTVGLFISLMTINDATRLWKWKCKCNEIELLAKATHWTELLSTS